VSSVSVPAVVAGACSSSSHLNRTVSISSQRSSENGANNQKKRPISTYSVVMNEEEELPDLVPNLYTDWVPPLPAKTKPNLIFNNVVTYEEFAEEFRKKWACAQFTDVKSIKETHGI
jgi:hypothetical protein